jgi:hypothetical protein
LAQRWAAIATVHDQQVPARLDLALLDKKGDAQGSFAGRGSKRPVGWADIPCPEHAHRPGL